jgi:hypothetical protein
VRFETLTAVKIQVQMLCFVTPCSVVAGYQRFRVHADSIFNSLHPEDGGSMDLRKAGILPQHYTASQLRRHRILLSAHHRIEGKRPLGRPRRRWEDNIKIYLGEIGIDGANWIRLAQDRVQCRAFVNTVMNLRVP